MALQNRDDLTTTIETNIPVGTSGGVTATNHRVVEENLADGIWKRVTTEIDDTDSPYTVDLDVTQVLLCDPTSGAITVNLPAIAGVADSVIYIKNVGTTNAVTIDGNSAEEIDGATTYSLSTQYDCVLIIAGSAEWHVLTTV